MSVEDPFDFNDNTARSVGAEHHEYEVTPFIAGAFERTANALLSLTSLEGAVKQRCLLYDVQGRDSLPPATATLNLKIIFRWHCTQMQIRQIYRVRLHVKCVD